MRGVVANIFAVAFILAAAALVYLVIVMNRKR